MKRTQPSDLDAHLGYWLRLVSNHVSSAFARRLEGRGVTVAEWVVLRELYGRAPTNPSRLAERLGLTRGAVSKLADRLVAKRLIERTADASDGRAQVLALTPPGADLVPELAALADQNDAKFFEGLSAYERILMRRALETLVRHHKLTGAPID